MSDRYLILGSGPAGMLAAWTLEREGVDKIDIDIFTKLPIVQSEISGAQFLHRPVGIPEDAKPDGQIAFAQIGTAEGYAEKIYGGKPIVTSWDRIDSVVDAWSLKKVYDKLWKRYEGRLIETTVTAQGMLSMLAGAYKVVFSSVPPSAYCTEKHDFPSVRIAIDEPWDDYGALDNIVIYSGRPEDPWYRISTIFGKTALEFGEGMITGKRQPKLKKAASDLSWDEPKFGVKPLASDCDCSMHGNENSMLCRIGRFGCWDRRLLLHDVPVQVRRALDAAL